MDATIIKMTEGSAVIDLPLDDTARLVEGCMLSGELLFLQTLNNGPMYVNPTHIVQIRGCVWNEAGLS